MGGTTRLLNSAAVLRWNTDKRYLGELEGAGIPIVPTQFLAPGDGPRHRFEDVEHVVKPVVSPARGGPCGSAPTRSTGRTSTPARCSTPAAG